MTSRLTTYLVAAILLLMAAFIIFRIYARGVYSKYRKLTFTATFLESIIWGPFFAFPYIYNDISDSSTWPIFWRKDPSVLPGLWHIGNAGIIAGSVLCLSAMASLGFRRSCGQKVNTLKTTGFYRLSRNPQVVLSFPLILGTALRWPSWFALGWILLFAAMIQMMVKTEEEHLRNVFGEEYLRYCEKVPRYL
jgi:hypothetical protein